MIFRLTTKARKRLHVAPSSLVTPGVLVLPTDWYCNVITLGHRPFFLFAHGLTLFGVLVPAAGNGTPTAFGDAFRRRAQELLLREGISEKAAARVTDDGPDAFATASDRRVIGSMVDFANMGKYVIEDEGDVEAGALLRANDELNESPMSYLGMKSPRGAIRVLLGIPPTRRR